MVFQALKALENRLKDTVGKDLTFMEPGKDKNYVAPNIQIGLKRSKNRKDYPLVFIMPTGWKYQKNRTLLRVALIVGIYSDENSTPEAPVQELSNFSSAVLKAVLERPVLDERFKVDDSEIDGFNDLQSNQPFYLSEIDLLIEVPYIVTPIGRL